MAPKQGSGKNIITTKIAKNYYDRGFNVVSNYRLFFPFEKLDFQKMVDCQYKKTVIIVDELHNNGFNSRQSMSKKNIRLTSEFIPFCRKKEIIFIGTTQLPRMCDIRLRENASDYYWTKKYVKIKGVWYKAKSKSYGKLPIMIKVEFLDIDNDESGVHYYPANKYYKLYDTEEVIKVQKMKDE